MWRIWMIREVRSINRNYKRDEIRRTSEPILVIEEINNHFWVGIVHIPKPAIRYWERSNVVIDKEEASSNDMLLSIYYARLGNE